jgi:aminopeptidase
MPFDRAAGWLYEGMAKALGNNTRGLPCVGDNPMLLSVRIRPRWRAPARRIPSPTSRRWKRSPASTSTGTSSPIPDLLGQAGVSRDDRGRRRRGKARRCDLRRIARRQCRSDRRLGRAQCGAAQPHRMAERPALPRAAFHRTGHRSRVGLADGHEWDGGASTAKNGITCNPNIPTEEVFTTPHASASTGCPSSTKPLSYQGTLIDDIAVRFEDGRSSRPRPRAARKC